MKIFIAGRQGGKTFRMMDELQKALDRGEDAYLIVAYEEERRHLHELYPTFENRRIITVRSALNGHGQQRSNPHYYIDNLDQVLPQILRGTVEWMSATTIEVENVAHRENKYFAPWRDEG